MYANPLTKRLNTITMHKLVQLILFGLLAVAVILGAFGAIRFSPPAIIFSAVVLGAFAIGANALLSRLYNVRSDSQSALITGLILALVLSPTLDPAKLGIFALVAIISQASKYILAIRGRHIFNPAAVGLVIASIAGLAFASWWVATPPLLPFLLIGTVTMLYKLRLLGFGAVFIVISAVIVVIQNLLTDTALWPSIVIAFTSWPILFFAGIMLSEPTTLPPRKWQKYLIAALVGVLFALPISIGAFHSNPAVALIIGNIVAFLFGQRRAISLTFKEFRQLTPSSKELVFTTTTPIQFAPGQYLDLFVPHKKPDFKSSRRSLSITSAPEQDLSLGIRFNEPLSTFKQQLLTLKEGDTIVASTISGDFTLPKDPAQKILMIAGGIGITPFISQIRALKAQNESRDIVLLHFVRSKTDTAYKAELKSVPHHTLVDTPITSDLIETLVPDIQERTAYISGPPAMVTSSKQIVRQLGAHKIKTDYFSGY